MNWPQGVLLACASNFLSQCLAQDFTLDTPGLYPENGAGNSHNGKIYYSSVYKASVVEYDPSTQKSVEIPVPPITGDHTAHISGIEVDKSGLVLWAIADPASAFQSQAKDMNGPEALISIKLSDKSVNVINLKPALEEARSKNGGSPVGGTQDAVVASDGSVYVIISFGQVILKVDPRTRKPSVFHVTNTPAPGLTYTGVEIVHKQTLITWNNAIQRFETFDLTTPNQTPKLPEISYYSTSKGGEISGDALFAPSVGADKCLLLSNNAAQTIEVFTSTDGWHSIQHTASIRASRYGGSPTFTYETSGKVYFGVSYFSDGPNGGNRSKFPQGDITTEVKTACASK